MNRETLEAYAAGLIAKGWTPTRDDLAEFAQADVESPHDAFEIGQLDAIAKAARWVLESSLAKLGYVRIPGEAKAKNGKGGNLVLARKGSDLRDKAEKLGLNKKADAKGEHGKPIASMTEREVRDELKLVQSKISFITRSMPVGQMTPTDPEGWNALHKRQHELHKMLAEHTRDADNAKVAAEELRRKEYNDANEKRKMALPTKQTRNGWDVATDGARWFLRDPATKEIVYDGTLKRVREVADESPPDVPEKLAPKKAESHPAATAPKLDGLRTEDKPKGKSAHEMTREEWAESGYSDESYDRSLYAAMYDDKITREEVDKLAIRDSMGNKHFWAKTRSEIEDDGKSDVKRGKADRAAINKMKATKDFAKWRIGSNSRAAAASIEHSRQYTAGLLAVHKDRVREALAEGKPVPAEVLADYPDLVKKYGNGANL